jgi:hypothetical protein
MAQSNKFQPALIHIGLPKTATTYMQTAWHNDPDTCLVRDALLPLIYAAENREKAGVASSLIPQPAQINFDTPQMPGQKLVFSNEAISGLYLNRRADKGRIRAFQEHVAAQLKASVPKSKILIVSRSPEKWIKSIYNQAVKQGSGDTFAQFLRRERDYIEQTLNIRELFTVWKQQFGSDNVLVLPMELLQEDEPGFFREIERFSGLPSPKPVHTRTINPSLQGSHLELMRQFNKWVELFVQHGKHQGKLPDNIRQALDAIRFEVRYDLETPPASLDRRLRLLERRFARPQGRDDAAIDRGLLKAIRGNFSKYLKKNDFFGYKKLYT